MAVIGKGRNKTGAPWTNKLGILDLNLPDVEFHSFPEPWQASLVVTTVDTLQHSQSFKQVFLNLSNLMMYGPIPTIPQPAWLTDH